MKRPLALAFVFTLIISACMRPQQQMKQETDSSSVRAAPVDVGDLAPEFTLEDQSRQKVTLSSARGERAVVLVFYRGYW